MSRDINTVFLSGRLARDPEVKYTASGQAVANVDLAVSISTKKGEEWVDGTMFLNKMTVWGKQAELFRDYIKRGDQVFIQGRLGVDEWETPEGNKRRQVIVTVENFTFGAKKAGGAGSYERESPPEENYSRGPAQPKPSQPPAFPAQPAGEDEDVPF